jgi:hypothetical protein
MTAHGNEFYDSNPDVDPTKRPCHSILDRDVDKRSPTNQWITNQRYPSELSRGDKYNVIKFWPQKLGTSWQSKRQVGDYVCDVESLCLKFLKIGARLSFWSRPGSSLILWKTNIRDQEWNNVKSIKYNSIAPYYRTAVRDKWTST